MLIRTTLSRDNVVELLGAFGTGVMWAPPLSQCDFVIDMSKGITGGVSENMIVTGFSIPEAGINFTQNAQYFGIYTPSFCAQPVNIEFLWSPAHGPSAFHMEYQNQFDSTGLIAVSKFSNLPDINLCAVYDGSTKILLKLEKCMFSAPVPVVNFKSAEFSPFRATAFYRDIKYNDQ